MCHKAGDSLKTGEALITCELCPRAYHSKCLGLTPASEDWVCPECEVSLTGINDTRYLSYEVLLRFEVLSQYFRTTDPRTSFQADSRAFD